MMPGPYEDNGSPDSYIPFAQRALRGLGKRAGRGDLSTLTELANMRGYIDELVADAVAAQRNDPMHPKSWTEIGDALGIARQVAQRRFAHVGGRRHVGGQPAEWR
jgi:hypothetical protein